MLTTSPAPTPTRPASPTRRNAALTVGSEALWGLGVHLVAPATVLTVVLSHYGASRAMIGVLGAVELGAVTLPQILGVYVFRSRRRLKAHIVTYHLAVMLPFLGLMAAVLLAAGHLSPAVVRWGVLGAFACFQFSMGVVTSVWFDWMAHLFRQEIRGKVLGLSFCLAGVAGSLGPVVAGAAIGRWAGGAYGWLYAAAAALATASVLTFNLVHDPAAAQGEGDAALPRLRDVWGWFAHSLGQANFRAYMVGRVLASLGFCILPFVALHYRSAAGGGLSDSAVVDCAKALPLGAAMGNLLMGWLGDRHGHRWGVLAASAIQGLGLGALLVLRGAGGATAVYALAGFAGGGGFMAGTNLLIETCPHENRAAHIALGNLVFAVPAIVGPVAAGMLAEHASLRAVFWVSLVLTLAAVTWYGLMFREPRRHKAGA